MNRATLAALAAALTIAATSCSSDNGLDTVGRPETTPTAATDSVSGPPLPTDPTGTICVATDGGHPLQVHTSALAAPTVDITVTDITLTGSRQFRQPRVWLYPDPGTGKESRVTVADATDPLPDGSVRAGGATLEAGTRYRAVIEGEPTADVLGGFDDVIVHYASPDHVGTARLGTRLVTSGTCR